MHKDRIALAREAGAFGPDMPARIAVFRPRADQPLSALPRDCVHVLQGFRPDHDAWVARGYETAVAPEGHYEAAVVCVPRAKAEARALIADAARVTGGGPVLVDGQKEDGIASLLKEVRARADIGGTASKAHGKAFWFTGGDFADWQAGPPRVLPDGFVTAPGVFSADGPDPGSAMLAEALPPKLPGVVVDLGAGWGFLSRAILARRGVEQLHLVEAEYAALACARASIDDPRALFHWADATGFGPDRAYDAVVSNPPFHRARAPDTALGEGFVAAAARLLKPSGRLWLVANRHLPYERAARAAFGEVREIAGDTKFKVIEAARPGRGSG